MKLSKKMDFFAKFEQLFLKKYEIIYKIYFIVKGRRLPPPALALKINMNLSLQIQNITLH